MSSLFGIGGGGNVGAAGGSVYGHTIDQSLRFEESGLANLTFTPSNDGTDNKKFTYSVWIKRGQESADDQHLIQSKNTGAGTGQSHVGLFLDTSNSLDVYTENGGANPEGTRLLRDHSAFYHFCFVYDTTQATDTERVKIFINGDRDTASTSTFPALNSVRASMNYNGQEQYIGKYVAGFTRYFNGLMAEIHMVDGQALAPTDFAEEVGGVWVPKKYTDNGTTSHGVNGYHLTFQGTGTATTSQGTTAQTNIGDDQSGNGNNWTANNLAATDVVLDSPTNTFATMNPIYHSGVSGVLKEGNLKLDGGGFVNTANGYGAVSTFAIPKDKKIYIEVECTDQTGSSWVAGFATQSGLESGPSSTTVGGSNSITVYNRSVMLNGSETDYGSSAGLGGLGVAKMAAGDILGMAIDGATGKVWFSRNGTYFKSPSTNNSGTTGDPSAGSNEIGTITGGTTEDVFVILSANASTNDLFINFGQDSVNVSSAETDANGLGTFEYAPPTDYVCLAASSLSDPTIGPGQATQADDHFDTILWTGNGTNAGDEQEINGLSFTPDFVWAKGRGGDGSNPASGQQYHELHDSVRGAGKRLFSNDTAAESDVQTLKSFDSDGFTVAMGTGAQSGTNQITTTMVGWSWKAGGTAVSNTDGSIISSVSANTDAGFSIVSYTGTGANATVGHGLSSAPEMVIVKERGGTGNWFTYHQDAQSSGAYVIYLNLTNASAASTAIWNNTQPTDTVFSLGTGNTNTNTDTYIAYCFHSVPGYQTVGSFVGNGSSDGTFVYTGHRVRFLLLKVASTTNNWFIYDNKREGYNQENNTLSPNDNSAEDNSYKLDLLSNGFKIRGSNNAHNQSGQTFVYLAIGSSFKFANAR